MPVARGQAKRPFVLNDIPAFTALLLHQKCGRATPRGEAQWICRYERAPLTIAKIENRITPACPYIFPSARRRSGMAARQVRRSVVMSNLRVGLLPMDSDRTPLGKGKNVLHGAVRAAPLEHSVEQPCVNTASVVCERGKVFHDDGGLDSRACSTLNLRTGIAFWPSWMRRSYASRRALDETGAADRDMPPQGQDPAPRARPRPRICGARFRPLSGGIRTGPSGAPSRLSLVPGRERLRPSSAGPTWACGSGCCSWPKSVGFNSG